MKTSELREKDMAALNQELSDLLKEQFNLRMTHGTGQLGQSHLLTEVRRNIARVRTIINEKARAENG